MRKVLNQPWCQTKQQAVMRPGKVTATKEKSEIEMKSVGLFSERYVKRSIKATKSTIPGVGAEEGLAKDQIFYQKKIRDPSP